MPPLPSEESKVIDVAIMSQPHISHGTNGQYNDEFLDDAHEKMKLAISTLIITQTTTYHHHRRNVIHTRIQLYHGDQHPLLIIFHHHVMMNFMMRVYVQVWIYPWFGMHRKMH